MAEKRDRDHEPLDADEIAALRKLLIDRDRNRWGRGMLKQAVIWTAGLTAGVVAFKDSLRDLIVWLGGGGPPA